MKNEYYFLAMPHHDYGIFGAGFSLENAINDAIENCGISVLRDKEISIYKTKNGKIINYIEREAECPVYSALENECEHVCMLHEYISDNFKKYFKLLI